MSIRAALHECQTGLRAMGRGVGVLCWTWSGLVRDARPWTMTTGARGGGMGACGTGHREETH